MYTDQDAVDAEAAKYAGTAVIESNVAVGTDITGTVARLLTGETADSSITLSYAAGTGDYLEVVGNAVKLKKQKTGVGEKNNGCKTQRACLQKRAGSLLSPTKLYSIVNYVFIFFNGLRYSGNK